MKKFLILTVTVLMVSSLFLNAKGKIRVGVYDSRAVAICYFRSEVFSKEMKEIMTEHKKAKENKDISKEKEFEEKGQLMQRIAHDKGFGRGSVAEILAEHENGIKKIAKENNLTLIVSKWELNYSGDDIEIVDITLLMMDLFKADENMKKMAKDLQKHDPVKDAFLMRVDE